MPPVRTLPAFRTAFQPIVDVETGLTIAQEALVRGPQGQSAASVLGAVAGADAHRLDAAIRIAAVAEALRLGLPATTAALTVNIAVPVIDDPDLGAPATLAAAEAMAFPPDRLVFEISEMEDIADPAALGAALAALQRRGVRVALDDVGTGQARMPLLLAFRPDGAKVAREVITGLDRDPAVRERVRGTLGQLAAFGLVPVVEGVETPAELAALRALGVRAMQGYLFARPAVGVLPVPVVPAP